MITWNRFRWARAAMRAGALLLAATAGVLPAGGAAAQSMRPASLPLLPDSRVWLEGRTNVNGYRCQAMEVRAHATFRDNGTGATEGVEDLDVAVSIQELRCGNGRMERDLRRALHAEEHPDIAVHVTGFRVRADAAPADDFQAEVIGELKVAGVARAIVLPVAGTVEGGTIRVRGSQPVRMTDFGIRPPRALLGAIRAADRVEFHFEIATTAAALAACAGVEEGALLRRLTSHLSVLPASAAVIGTTTMRKP